jgi:hypothetical protein
VWFSLGVMAVTADDTARRVVALPPFWLLGLLAIGGAALGWFTQPRPVRLLPLILTLLLWLPYVPGPVPALFLMWQGPIEIGVWALAIAGIGLSFIQPRETVEVPPDGAHSRRGPWIAAGMAALAYAAGAAALSEQLPIGDEPHYLMMTQSLIKDGDLRIENNHRNHDYASFAKFDIPPHYLTRGTDGEIYSVHPVGVSVLVLPAFAIFGYYGGVATVMLCVALASAMAWRAAWLLTRHAPAAWIAWSAVFLTAPMYLQAVTVFPDAVGALPVMAGVWLLIALEMGVPITDGILIAAGVALATLPWFHSRFALLAGGLGAAIALRLIRQRWRRVAWFLAVPVVSAVLWFGFFWWIWGSPNPAAPWGAAITTKVELIPRGVNGLLFDPQAGLLIPAPAYIATFIGWVLLLRAKPRLALEVALIAAVSTASVASYDAWWGGKGAPARYLVAELPLLVAPAAWLASRHRLVTRACAMVVLLSLLMLTARVSANGGAFAFTPETGVNPVFTWMSPAVALPSLGLQPTASQLAFLDGLGSGNRPSGSLTLTVPAEGSIAPARHAARLGDVSVFFMDDRAYPEPTGFWAPADRAIRVVMDREDPSRNLGLRLQSGPVPTTVEVEIDGERRAFTFMPKQRHEIAIQPATTGAWRITIRSGAGFRPVDFDPDAKDARSLGVWVEVF